MVLIMCGTLVFGVVAKRTLLAFATIKWYCNITKGFAVVFFSTNNWHWVIVSIRAVRRFSYYKVLYLQDLCNRA